MSSPSQTAHQKPFLTINRDNKTQWVQKVCTEDGVREIPVANDVLYASLELRYGPGFAQWVIDGLDKKAARA
jgi:hypothetical protein